MWKYSYEYYYLFENKIKNIDDEKHVKKGKTLMPQVGNKYITFKKSLKSDKTKTNRIKINKAEIKLQVRITTLS